MDLFASDLDNTLIYSYKREIGLDKVPVEQKGGMELTYMTEFSYQMLNKIKDAILFVPITVRSLEQYQRIQFHPTWMPQLALVANGGILVKNSKIDQEWYEESLDIMEPSRAELERSLQLLQADCYAEPPCFVDRLFVFTKSNCIEKSKKRLEESLDLSRVSVCVHRNKLYVVPCNMNKGLGLLRLKKSLNLSTVVSAGDSGFDVPMLELADVAIFPAGLIQNQKRKFIKNAVEMEEGIIYSDFILDYINRNLL